MAIKQVSLHTLNTLNHEAFISVLAALFEGPPWIVSVAWSVRPFADLTQLHAALCAVMYHAPIEQQIELLRAHPDLVGRAAQAGTLTPASTQEQAAAGLDHLSAEDIATFTHLNQAYHERFDFPFVICARENKRESILAGFAARLHNSQEQEIAFALGEVARICWLRLRDLVHTDTDDHHYRFLSVSL